MKNCITCGAQIEMDVVICPVCGANQNPQATIIEQPIIQNPIPNPNQNQPQQDPNVSDKEKTTALILCILPYFIQIHGIHRFYTGHIGIGIIQLITWGGCGIWTLIDLIQIISGSYKDAQGRTLKGKDIF
jgi:TM2 domain-containing membrane protein YozV